MDHSSDSSEAGIVITPEEHHKGYATEAMYLLLEHGFSSLDVGGMALNRIKFTTARTNVAMRRWLDRVLGATEEGTFREAWKCWDGGYIDAVGYAILKRDWFEGGAKLRLAERVERVIFVPRPDNTCV